MKKNKSAPATPLNTSESGEDVFLEDHQALQVVLSRVDRANDLGMLIPMLDELHRLLQGHFHREEAADGPYHTIGEIAPRHLGRLKELVDQHGDFLTRVLEVRKRAQDCLDGPVAQIHRDVAVLRDALQQHESDETALFMDALNTDLGQSE